MKKCKDAGTKHFNCFKAFIEYSNNINDIYIKTLNNTIKIKNVKY